MHLSECLIVTSAKGGYVFGAVYLSVCLFVCLSVGLSAGLRKKLLTDIDEIWWMGAPGSKDKPIRFW